MICPSCGMKNNYYHRYCFHCGKRLNNEEPSETIPISSNADSQSSEEITAEEHQSTDSSISSIPWKEQPAVDSANIEDSGSQDSGHPRILNQEPENFESESQPGAISFDDFFLNFSAQDEEEPEFDIQSQLPLRRYRKAEKNEDGLQKLIKAFISIVLIALIGFLVYVGYIELIQKRAANQPVAKVIDFEYRVEETELNGHTARKIIVISSLGEQIKVKDEVAAVISGQAEIILPDREFELKDYEQSDGALQVILPLTVLADGYPSRTEDIQFEVPVQGAPVEFISPSNQEAVVDGTTYQLILKVLPGSNVFVDGNNYSHLVDDEGRFSLQLEISEQPETRYEIRVSTKGYGDLIDEVVLKKRQMEFPLSIDQKIPIQAAEDVWVEVTGKTHPEAVLSSNLETREAIELDSTTGNFRLFVRVNAKGYTPFILTAKLEGKEDSIVETVIQRPVNESDYTRSAWALEYDNLKAYPDLHNGIPFVFIGNITDVQSTGTRTTLLVNVAAQGQPEKLVYVEYWGTMNAIPGQRVRVFGNHWGNKDEYPYILAPYIYKSE